MASELPLRRRLLYSLAMRAAKNGLTQLLRPQKSRYTKKKEAAEEEKVGPCVIMIVEKHGR